MSKILLLGLAPLPFENTTKTFGPGIRAWQFAKPLISQGHELLLIASRIPFVYKDRPRVEVISQQDNFKYIQVEQQEFEMGDLLHKQIKEFEPDCIVGATSFPSYIASLLEGDLPAWMDLFGSVMAEAQAKAYAYGDDSYIRHFWRHTEAALDRGDAFSSVSNYQKYALIGELGTRGRLNAATAGYEFVHTIPCGIEGEPYKHTRQVTRGIDTPKDAFIVLHSGGYNTWMDVKTLFHGLEKAMAKDPSIYFVSTGGAIQGHDEMTYPWLEKAVTGSRFKGRFILKGWQPKDDVHNYYFEADVGINLDKHIYEGLLGSRNRFLDWMRAGLIAVTTELCELSSELINMELFFKVNAKDADHLAQVLLKLSADRDKLPELRREASEFVFKRYSFEETTKPLIAWADSPKRAPDAQRAVDMVTPLQARLDRESKKIQRYLQKLEAVLDAKNSELLELRRYLRHVESENRKILSQPWMFALYKLKELIFKGKQKKNDWRPLKPLPKKPLVSVVIVTYNSQDVIEDCLHSLYASKYHNMEVIVVDNDSSDNTVEIIKRKFPGIKVIEAGENLGFAGGNNLGFRHASGQIIFMLNPDTVIEPGTIGSLVEFMASDTRGEIGMVGCKLYNSDKKTLQHCGGILHPNALTDHFGAGEADSGLYERMRDVDYVTGAALAFRADLLDVIGQLPTIYYPAYYEELDFCCRARKAGYRVVYYPKAKLVHKESTILGKLSQRFLYLYHRNRLIFVLMNYSLRGIFDRFLPAELGWLKNARPRDQLKALLKAYSYNIIKLPITLFTRWFRVRRRL